MGATALTRRVLGLAACGSLALGVTACTDAGDGTPDNADVAAGKQLFVEKCGSCHTMARAGTKGTQGPNLDEAFREALEQGFGRGGVRGIVEHQIQFPARGIEPDNPAYMPKDLVKGPDVVNVAAYVAQASAKKGKDTGFLAVVVKPAGSGKPVDAKGGKLELPADPTGQLAYITTKANAPAGPLEIASVNKASIPHDIALEGNGVNEKGETVQGGGTSSVKADVKPGKYQFFCSVPGHREGGMEGTLTVK